MQVQSPAINKEKIADTVQKYVELIKQNKIYEFLQKIELLAHRKQQSKKFEQAEYLLFCGIEKLLLNSLEDKQQCYSFFDHLIKIYEGHPEIWNLSKAKKIYELLNIRKSDIKYQYYVKFLKTLKNRPFPKQLLLELIKYYIDRDQYTKAESHVLELDTSFVRNFMERWIQKANKQQSAAIQCRLALLKGLFSNFQQYQELLEGVNENSPYFRFAKFLATASKLKSREAYDLIGSRYKQFLDNDQIYSKIYQGYGSYYFKIKNAGKDGFLQGLLG